MFFLLTGVLFAAVFITQRLSAAANERDLRGIQNFLCRSSYSGAVQPIRLRTAAGRTCWNIVQSIIADRHRLRRITAAYEEIPATHREAQSAEAICSELLESLRVVAPSSIVAVMIVFRSGSDLKVISFFGPPGARWQSSALTFMLRSSSEQDAVDLVLFDAHELELFGIELQSHLRQSSSPYELWLGFSKIASSTFAQKSAALLMLAKRALTSLAQLKRVSDAIERSRDERDYLLGLSHDIRAPGIAALHAIREMNQNQVDRPGLQRVEGLLLEQMHLIADLIDLERNDRDALTARTEIFPLSEGLADLEDALSLRAQSSGVRLTIRTDASIVIRFDRQHFRRILLNLLRNALKFTNAGSVSLTTSRSEGGLVVCVSDTGSGIPEELRRELFQPFTANTYKPSGSGLGLAICYALAAKNGADLRYEPRLPNGSLFSLYLPSALIAECPTSGPGYPPPSDRILVVEDDEATIRFYERTLRHLGHEMICAESIFAAMEIMNAGTPIGCVITDMKLPDGECTELIDLIHLFGSPPVIVASGMASATNLDQRIFAALEKPLDRPSIEQAIRSALQSRSREPLILNQSFPSAD